mmetsp:Transcript_5867/g.13591  ORF Transcript_5867/g.13591 Transcript_5867/m.13591 type:complete len:109 (-) Transcript_5867:180-506(-)
MATSDAATFLPPVGRSDTSLVRSARHSRDGQNFQSALTGRSQLQHLDQFCHFDRLNLLERARFRFSDTDKISLDNSLPLEEVLCSERVLPKLLPKVGLGVCRSLFVCM